MQNENISIVEMDAIKAIIDVIGKCHNTYKKISNAQNDAAPHEFYKAYRWLCACCDIIASRADANLNFANHEVNFFELDKHGLVEIVTRKDFPVFVYKALCLQIDAIVSAIYQLEQSNTLNRSLYLDYLHSARTSITHAKYMVEYEMEYIYH